VTQATRLSALWRAVRKEVEWIEAAWLPARRRQGSALPPHGHDSSRRHECEVLEPRQLLTGTPPEIYSVVAESRAEGEQVGLLAGFLDADAGPAPQYVTVVDWGDGTGPETVSAYPTAAGAGEVVGSHAYADDGTYPLTLTLVDAGGETAAAAANVGVAAAAPQVGLGVPGPTVYLGFGQTLSANWDVVDPGDTVYALSYDWGDGTIGTSLTADTHVYAAPGTYALAVTAWDEDGVWPDAGAYQVVVGNPSFPVSLDAVAALPETDVYALSFSADLASGIDSISYWQVDWGDGGTDTYAGAGAAAGVGYHAYQPGSYTINVGASGHAFGFDAAGGAGTVVEVADVVPSVTFAAVSAVDEGSEFSLAFTVVGDPWDAVTGWAVDWGDGSSDAYAYGAGGGVGWHDYRDGPGEHTYAVYALDEDGANGLAGTVSVADVAPTLALSGNYWFYDDEALTLAFSAAGDPGDDTVAAWSVDWGDGTTESYAAGPAGTYATHDYPSFAGDYVADVTVAAIDEDGSYSAVAGVTQYAATDTSSVTHTPPTVYAAGDYWVQEGGTVQASFYSEDADGDSVTAWTVDWGDGTTDTFAAAGMGTSAAHAYADGNADYVINVTAYDPDGAWAPASGGGYGVSVANVAPDLTLGWAAPPLEGTPFTLDLSATDPGQDAVTSWIVDWGDGSVPQTFAGAAPADATHAYADGDAAVTITATAADEDGTYAAAAAVLVGNVAPDLTLGGDFEAFEGAPFTLSFSASDPGDDTITAWTVDWGDGTTPPETYQVGPAGGQATHTYADGPAVPTILVTAADEDGTWEASAARPVRDVDPLVTVAGDLFGTESGYFNISFASGWDPGVSDGVTAWTVDWGDGGGVDTFGDTGPSGAAASHYYASSGQFPVTVWAIDKDGPHAAGWTANVVPALPQVYFSPPDFAVEGEPATAYLGYTPPGQVDYWSVDWGDGTTQEFGGEAQATHTYADGDAGYDVVAVAHTPAGDVTSAGFVRVDNAPPTIGLSGDYWADEGRPYTLSYAASDAGEDTVTAWSVDWGDGSVETYGPGGTASHTYADGPTIATLAVSAVDEDGAWAASAATLAVRDVSPELSVVGVGDAVEGTPFALDLSTGADPGTDAVTAWVVEWGDGTTESYAIGAAGTAWHTYADGESVASVNAYAVDEDGPHGTSLFVHVLDAPPAIALVGPDTVPEGQPYTLGYSAADLGADTVTLWTIDWGTGGGYEVSGVGAAGGTLSTAVTGTNLRIVATAANEDGGFASEPKWVAVAPAAPSGLVAGAYAASGVALGWVDASGMEGGYEVQRSTDPLFPEAATTTWFTLADATAYDDLTAAAGTTYYYRVRAFRVQGMDEGPAPALVASAFSTAAAATTPPSADPVDLVVQSTTATTALLTWTAPAVPPAGGYAVFRGNVRLAGTTAATPMTTTTAAAYQDAGLTPGTAYSYVVWSLDAAGGLLKSSNTAVATTSAAAASFDTASPPTPGSLTVTATAHNATLRWSYAGEPATFAVYQDGTFVGQTGTSGSQASYSLTVNGLEAGLEYDFAVRAQDPTGNVSAEARQAVTTLADQQQPDPVVNPVVTSHTAAGVRLAWTVPYDDGGVASYVVRRQEFTVGGNVGSETVVGTVPATDQPEILDAAADPTKAYGYTIYAYDAAGNSSAGTVVVNPMVQYLPYSAPDFYIFGGPPDYVDQAPEQYIPEEYSISFRDTFTSALRDRWAASGSMYVPPPAEGWLDGQSASHLYPYWMPWPGDLVVVGGSSMGFNGAVARSTHSYYWDINRNSRFDAGSEPAWRNSQQYDSSFNGGSVLLAGAVPGSDADGTPLEYYNVDGDLTQDADEPSLLADLERVHASATSVAYTVGTPQQPGYTIWRDDGDRLYEAGERVYLGVAPAVGTVGRSKGAHAAELPNEAGGTTDVVWIDGTTLRADLVNARRAIPVLFSSYANPGRSTPDRPFEVNLGDALEAAHSGDHAQFSRTYTGTLAVTDGSNSSTGAATVTFANLTPGTPVAVGQNVLVGGAWYRLRSKASSSSETYSIVGYYGAALSGRPVVVADWTKVPEAAETPAFPALHWVGGQPGFDDVLFPEQFKELYAVLGQLQVRLNPPYDAPSPAPFTAPSAPLSEIPRTTELDLFNVVPDTDADDLVDVDHDQRGFGPDTGSIQLQLGRDQPQAILPVGDGSSSQFAPSVHAYFAAGGFAAAAGATAPLRSKILARDNPLLDEDGSAWAYSLNTRLRVNVLLNDGVNHVKRLEVIRPRGNAVVFEFPWDESNQVFQPTGFPVGTGKRDGNRTYVLRQVGWSTDAGLTNYELQFASGITHVFNNYQNGYLAAVRNDAAGVSAQRQDPYAARGTDGYMTNVATYDVKLALSAGQVVGADYRSKGSPAAVIQSRVTYGAGGLEVVSITKSVGGVAATPLSYDVTAPGVVRHAGRTVTRTGSATPGGTVTLRVASDDAPVGYREAAVTFDANRMPVRQVDTLVAPGPPVSTTPPPTSPVPSPASPSPVTTTATTTWEYPSASDRYPLSGVPKWSKVKTLTNPDGSWATYAYDQDSGWVTSVTTPYQNGQPGASGQVVEAYEYKIPAGTGTTLLGASGELADYTRRAERPRVMRTTVAGQVVGSSLSRYHAGEVTTKVASVPGVPRWNGPGLLTTVVSSGGRTVSTPVGSSVTRPVTQLPAVQDEATVETNYFGTVIYSARATVNGRGGTISASSYGLGTPPSNGAAAGGTDSFGRVLRYSTLGRPDVAYDYGSGPTLSWYGPLKVTRYDTIGAGATAGAVTAFDYYPTGRVHTATTTLTPRAGEQVVTVETFSYDVDGNVVKVGTSGTATVAGGGTQPAAVNTVSQASYDVRGRLTSYTDEQNQTTTYTYQDSANTGSTVTTSYPDQTYRVKTYRLDGSPDAVSGTAAYPAAAVHGVVGGYNDEYAGDALHPAGSTWSRTTASDGADKTTTFFDTLGRPYRVEQTAPASAGTDVLAVSTREYDPNGRVRRVVDFDGTVTLYTYDARTGLADVTLDVNRDGAYTPGVDRKTTTRYTNTLAAATAQGIVTRVLSDAGVTESKTTYESYGLKVTDVVNGETTVTNATFKPTGELAVTTTAPDGTRSVATSRQGLPLSSAAYGTDGTTVVTSEEYKWGSLGRLWMATDPAWGTTTYDRRADGTPSKVTYPDGRTTVYADFDAKTNAPTATTRPDQGEQNQSLNSRGQTETVSGTGVIPQRLGYDGLTGQLTSLTTFRSGEIDDDSSDAATGWAYDPASGLLTAKTWADGSTDEYKYNAGLQLRQTVRPGQTTDYAYNNAGELTQAAVVDPAHGNLTTLVATRDDAGRPLLTTQVGQAVGQLFGGSLQTAVNAYTNLGQLKLDKSGDTGAGTAYEYYGPTENTGGAAPGALRRTTVRKGDAVLQQVTYAYDAVTKRPDTVTVLAKGQNGQPDRTLTYSYSYKPGTDLVEAVTVGGVGTTSYEYEPHTGRLHEVTVEDLSDSTLYGTTYAQYTPVDQRQAESTTYRTAAGTTVAYTAGYAYADARDGLTGATRTYTAGGLPDESYGYAYDAVGNRTSATANGVTATHGYNDLNQVVGYAYDARGNLTGDGAWAYGWDAADRLASTTRADGLQRLEFAYDPAGRRVEKRVYDRSGPDDAWAADAGETRRYAWDGDRVTAEFDGANHLRTAYAWGPTGLLAVTDHTPAAGGPVAYVPVLDGTGSVVALLAADGSVAATFRYDPYGNPVGPADLAAGVRADGVCGYRFAGGQFDAETGLQYHLNRYYSPRDGRFLSRDPIAEAGGVNVYAYAGGDPIRFSDPTGLDRVEARWEQDKFKLYYVDEPSIVGGVFSLGLNYLAGDSDPVYVGDVDPDSGYVRLPSGLYTTAKAIKDEVNKGGTSFDESWERTHAFGKNSRDWQPSGLRGSLIRFQQQGDELKKEKALDFNPQPEVDEIMFGTSLAAEQAEQLLWFYATAPLELAQTLKTINTLKGVDKVKYAQSPSIAAVSAARANRGLNATDNLKLGNLARKARIDALERALTAKYQPKIKFIDVQVRGADGRYIFGQFDAANNVINLYKGSNQATRIHELLHARQFAMMTPARRAEVLRDLPSWRKGLEVWVDTDMARLGFIPK
jgi:RHS repeat-associated protein